jgi:hypothetical protein
VAIDNRLGPKEQLDEDVAIINEVIGRWYVNAADENELSASVEIKQALMKFGRARERRGW